MPNSITAWIYIWCEEYLAVCMMDEVDGFLDCCRLIVTDRYRSITDLSPLPNGIWEIHAGCFCYLCLQLLAKINASNARDQNEVSLISREWL